jgi:hypothetical protein
MKILKVKSCKKCPYKSYKKIVGFILYSCRKEVDYTLRINSQVRLDEIHPDCPLEYEKIN